MSTTRLDTDAEDTEPVTWLVLIRHYGEAEGGAHAYDSEPVTEAATVDLIDGALVFRGPDGELVKSYGPSGWLEVRRA